ncbi:hypothetical protein Purlil1_909 [Purpureocillium lilacinum]|uniref:Uncharacterized protein n=1 Tax=Purpureocillium lilacinum TaxID=33203 RepID=A0ABR0CD02_PURLI|nr:hypothetical protein Purlil1_909 [Purpureocillium lilacinum]
MHGTHRERELGRAAHYGRPLRIPVVAGSSRPPLREAPVGWVLLTERLPSPGCASAAKTDPYPLGARLHCGCLAKAPLQLRPLVGPSGRPRPPTSSALLLSPSKNIAPASPSRRTWAAAPPSHAPPQIASAFPTSDTTHAHLTATDTSGPMARLDDLFAASAKLQALAEDSDQLQDARRRFETTPPACRSRPSAEITQLHTPGPANEEERRLRNEKARFFYIQHHWARSRPYDQFHMQKSMEIGFLVDKWRETFGPRCYGSRDDPEMAERLVRARWVEWGIWSEEWKDEPEGGARWDTDHVVPIDLNDYEDFMSGAKMQRETVERGSSPGSGNQAIADPAPEPVGTTQHRDDDNSRPYNLFLLLVGVERQRLRRRSAIKSDPHDINTQAYNVVRKEWEKEGIWRTTWGTLPGMTWKHEHPLEDIIDEEAGLTLEELDHTKYYTTTERLAALPDDTDDTDPGTPYSVRSMSPVRPPRDAGSPPYQPKFNLFAGLQSSGGSGHFHPGKRPLPDADALFPIRGESHQSAEPETPDSDGVPMQVSQQSCEMTGANNPFKGLFGKPVTSSGPVENSNGTDPDSAPCPPYIETANGKSSPTDKPSTARKSPKRKRGAKPSLDQASAHAIPLPSESQGRTRRSKRLAAKETTASPDPKPARRGKRKVR